MAGTKEEQRERAHQYYLANREKRLAYQKEYAATHKAQNAVWQRQHRVKNAARIKDTQDRSRLRISYNFTVEEYAAMRADQEGRCAICRREEADMDKKGLCIDHDHATGVVRGLLCNSCNVALGHLRDNVSLVERAADYLRVAERNSAADPCSEPQMRCEQGG